MTFQRRWKKSLGRWTMISGEVDNDLSEVHTSPDLHSKSGRAVKWD
jgi:hypothetical protein